MHFNGSLRITNFSHEDFHLGFSLLQMIIVLHPFRIRYNRDTGTDMQQGPAQRFLFRLRPCVNLFYCLLLLLPLRKLYTTGRDTSVFGIFVTPDYCSYLETQGLLSRELFSPVYVIKSEYLRECSASRVRPYMHQLRIMSLVKCWVCPAPGFAALCSIIIG